jgi:hypothetical protein
VERRTTLLLKKSSLPEEVIQRLRPQCSRTPGLYRLPKIHKDVPPLRAIVSTIGAATYRLPQYPAKLLRWHVGHSPRHVRNSTEFINVIKSLLAGPKDIVVSSDVVSLFTVVPLGQDLRS